MTLYYGCDSLTDSFPCGKDFYIGRLGYGTKEDLSFFNTSAAATLGPARTYAYWGLVGPEADPNYDHTVTEATNWGTAQADAFDQAWKANGAVGTKTLFADVERGFGGWLDPSIGNNDSVNHAVYSGFLNRLKGLSYNPAVYSSWGEWEAIMGTLLASPAAVEWAADWLSSPTPCPTSFGPTGFGGLTPTIWQYYGSQSNDQNVATSLLG